MNYIEIFNELKEKLKLAQEIDSPYNRYLHKITKPKELIQIHKIYDATIDLLIENTDIYKDPF